MSKHHANEYRACVGGKWAGSEAETVFPCVIRGQHLGECQQERERVQKIASAADFDPATLTDEQRARLNCQGCLPREATDGWLCEHCHRYFAQWLGDGSNSLLWVHGWLGRQLGPLRSAAIRDDWQRPADADSLPSPLNEAIHDCRQLLEDRVYTTDERLHFAQGDTMADLPAFNLGVGLAFLRRSLLRIEDDRLLVAEAFRKFQDVMILAHGLAPWRATATKVRGKDGPIPCPACERKSLMQFGGDDFVTCTSCGATVSEHRFGIWTRMLEEASA